MQSIALVVLSLLAVQKMEAPRLLRLISWAEDAGPAGREHAVFLSDLEGGRAVLFSGSGYKPYGTPLGDAWAFDFASETWSPIEVVGDVPPAAGSRRSAAVTDGAFLFGGYLANELDDALLHLLFEGNQLEIERIPQKNPPQGRALHGFACDPTGKRFVVFGGGTETGILGDTWIGRRGEEGVTWESLDSENGPSERFGFAFGYDPETHRFLVCSGQLMPDPEGPSLAFAHDLWALNFEADLPSWTLLAEFDPKIFPGRRNPAFVFDGATGDLFVWGGTMNEKTALPGFYVVRTRVEGAPVETFEESGGTKTRASGFGVIDEKSRRLLLGFGNTHVGPFTDLASVRLRRPMQASGAK